MLCYYVLDRVRIVGTMPPVTITFTQQRFVDLALLGQSIEFPEANKPVKGSEAAEIITVRYMLIFTCL